MQRQSTIALWCERVIEGGWLLALVFIPTYFNLLSARHFEPEKAASLRAIVLVMAAAGIVRALELRRGRPAPAAGRGSAPPGAGPLKRAWRRLAAFPLARPTLLYALVFLLTTATSVVPQASFWGSYQRLQGTYTTLSYIALAAMIALTLRRREQLDRLITVMILGSLPAVGYGLVQHFDCDPLPWKSDVISRAASTMGNSIFVAAYLIMIVPYALFRAIEAFRESRTATERGGGADLGWAAAYALLVLGTLGLLFATLKCGAATRAADLRSWWLFPAALFVAYGLFLVAAQPLHRRGRMRLRALWPVLLAAAFVAMVFLSTRSGPGAGAARPQPGHGGADWPAWMVGGLLLVLGAHVLFLALPRREAPTRLLQRLHGAGMLAIAGLQLVTILFTQSRGPWIGLAAGLFTFVTLLLAGAYRRARKRGDPRAARWRFFLAGEVGLALALGGLVVAFNTVHAPFLDRLREVPFLGRMGTLLETGSGTGLVRRLIWFGDDKAGGTAAMIVSDPVRLALGRGPESMFVAYNRFYPPALANIEARGSSPDRAHQAYLDELVTRGLLGLASYLYVMGAFFALACRLVRHASGVLGIACISAVTAHLVEGLTGIPIVATLMMLWVTMAAVVAAGTLEGRWTPGAVAPVPGAGPATAPGSAPGSGERRRAVRAAALVAYALIGALALAGAWFLNVDNIYADMRFRQGRALCERPDAGGEQLLAGVIRHLEAIRMEPAQDFYYLNLGRALMNLAAARREAAPAPGPGGPLGRPVPDADVSDLLRAAGRGEVRELIWRQAPLETMSYAEAAMAQGLRLSPLNKDHCTNLARLHGFWYSRLTQDPEHLRQSIRWYELGHQLAPQEVIILNEYATSVALMGSYAGAHAGEAAAWMHYEQADRLLARSKSLDPHYLDTDLRIADLRRLEGRAAEATDLYVKLLGAGARAIEAHVAQIVDSLRDQPDQLRRLRDGCAAAAAGKPDDAALLALIGLASLRLNELPQAAEAFGRWVRLRPQSIEARRQYTAVLSDTRRYPQALAEAQAMLSMAQQQRLPPDEQAAMQRLVEFLQSPQRRP